MRIIPLYKESDTKFSYVNIYGMQYLINKNNPSEKEYITSKLNGNHLYKQENDYFFLYENRLFRIEGAKACELHFSSSTKDYLLLMVYGNDEYVYFYSVCISKSAGICKNQFTKEVNILKLGSVRASNFEYFIYFFKKSITTHDAAGNSILTMYDKEFVKESNPFFILKAISKCLKENWKDFRLVPFSNSKEAFSQNNVSESKITTFIKLTRDKMYYYDIVGNDFTILKNYVWEEYDIIDDWEYYQDPDWTTCYRDWILNGTQLINISDFTTYDVKRFMNKFKNPDVTLWKPNEDEIYVFFTEKSEESKTYKNGILWNLKKNTIYPNNVNLDDNAVCEPILFWHWNCNGIPNVTFDSNKNIFKIWYRRGSSGELINIESYEAPIVFFDDRGNQIYFGKNHDYDYMLIINKTFNLVSFRIGVSFFEEISFYKRYPANLQRNINDEGKYFLDKSNHYFSSNSIIIVKETLKDNVVFLVYFGYAFYNLNSKYSFKSYTFLPENNDVLKIQIEGNTEFTKPHYIVITVSGKSFES